jgi:hypothetical protein
MGILSLGCPMLSPSAYGKGAADPEMLIDDLIALLRPALRRKN